MEGLRKAYSGAVSQAQESSAKFSSLTASWDKAKSLDPSVSSSVSPEQSNLLLTRSQRQVVSLWTCSKLCAVCFVAGVFVGYTLKRRVSRWASKLLRRLKDD